MKWWKCGKDYSEPQGYAERRLGSTVSILSVQDEAEGEYGVGWESAISTTCLYVHMAPDVVSAAAINY
jgi:hypothetical protein